MWAFLPGVILPPPGLSAEAAPTPWALPLPGAPAVRLVHQEIYLKLGLPYLRVAFYADPAALAARPKGVPARAWVLRGRVWCARRSVVLQGIGARLRVQGLEAQLRAHWPDGAFDPQRPEVKALLAASAKPLRRRDTLEYIWTPGGQTHIRRNAEPWATYSDRALQQALLRIAFGNEADPELPALERALEAFGLEGR